MKAVEKRWFVVSSNLYFLSFLYIWFSASVSIINLSLFWMAFRLPSIDLDLQTKFSFGVHDMTMLSVTIPIFVLSLMLRRVSRGSLRNHFGFLDEIIEQLQRHV